MQATHDHAKAAEAQLEAAARAQEGSTPQILALGFAHVEALLAVADAMRTREEAPEMPTAVEALGPYSLSNPTTLEVVAALTDATDAGWTVEFDYERKDGSDGGRRLVTPSSVEEMGPGWFLFGQDARRQGEYRAFNVERIKHLTIWRD